MAIIASVVCESQQKPKNKNEMFIFYRRWRTDKMIQVLASGIRCREFYIPAMRDKICEKNVCEFFYDWVVIRINRYGRRYLDR